MSEIKVTTEQLWTDARDLANSAVAIGRASAKNTRAINKMEDSCSFMTVAGIYVSANQLIQRFSNLMNTLSEGANKAMQCAAAYEEANQQLINEFSDWFESVEVNTINGSTEAFAEKQRLDEIIRKYNVNEKIDTSNYPRKIFGTRSDDGDLSDNDYYFIWENGCTWYAFNRWMEMNNSKLIFSMHPGNASNWANAIDKNYFNCVSSNEANAIVANAIAVDTSGNHVVYIEGIRDGMVYYSESSYTNPSSAGKVNAKTIEQFMNVFEYIITQK